MKFSFDTSSLLALTRYYLPFDRERVLTQFIEAKFTEGSMVFLARAYEEYRRQKAVAEALPFIQTGKKRHLKDEDNLPNGKLIRMVESNFAYREAFNRLSEEEREQSKNNFIRGVDFGLITLGYRFSKSKQDFTLITEETPFPNDKKAFRKIPAICEQLGVKTLTLPEWLQDNEELAGELFGWKSKENG